jgi:HAD superfamily hydrolase (TIGR01509 family)
MIFDLDGTLVQTEKLNARSYALAAVELSSGHVGEEEVLEAFAEVVGLPRQAIADDLVTRFELTANALRLAPSFGVETAWQSYVQLRLRYYQEMISDPAVIRANTSPHNIGLLNLARRTHCKTALATMSNCEQANHVIDTLQLRNQFDFVATRDDVTKGKPDPEIYSLVATQLQSDPADCLVIEDSPAGVAAALRAGMRCVAVATPFTRQALHSSGLLEEQWIVDDPAELIHTVESRYSTEPI